MTRPEADKIRFADCDYDEPSGSELFALLMAIVILLMLVVGAVQWVMA